MALPEVHQHQCDGTEISNRLVLTLQRVRFQGEAETLR